MREEIGVKLQIVTYQCKADHEGVINVKNKVSDEGWSEAFYSSSRSGIW